MADVSQLAPPPTPEMLLAAYRAALKRYDVQKLQAISQALGLADAKRSSRIPEMIAEHWSEPRGLEQTLAQLPKEARVALTLFGLIERPTWIGMDLSRALRLLGVDPLPAITPLVDLGILVMEPDPAEFRNFITPDLFLKLERTPFDLRIHPTLLGVIRTTLPNPCLPTVGGDVRQVRKSDGLEVLLRTAAVWQRVSEAPLRRTLQGAFFKRDRERIEEDATIAGPISDVIEPLPDIALFSIAIGEVVGLIGPEPESDRIIAACPAFWAENAVHLPQMLAVRWLGLKEWHELGGSRLESNGPELTTLSLRLPLLLWLATVEPDLWVPLAELIEHLDQLRPNWGADLWPLHGTDPEQSVEQAFVEAVLLGPAYQLGLIQAGEESVSGRRLVRLTSLGRYVLALGNPPAPPETFEHFLYVQPNFEIIAYRQGLTPSLIGKLSRFAHWSKLGAATELKLTSDSVYRGLEGGMKPDEMIGLLQKHSSRPLAPSVGDSIQTWSSRRERVTYYAAATLIEFATADELEAALKDWPSGFETPIPIAPRLLLVHDVASIPFQRFRQAGARDYRRPAEPCVEVGPDGVSLGIELGRSDLLVDAEIIRFADELPSSRDGHGPRRRFQVTREALARGVEAGLTSSQLSKWFIERAGVALPPSIRLMLHAVSPGSQPVTVGHLLVLEAPSEELLDGLLQHPATRDAFAERIGPRHASVLNEARPALEKALSGLGLKLQLSFVGEAVLGSLRRGKPREDGLSRDSLPRSHPTDLGQE